MPDYRLVFFKPYLLEHLLPGTGFHKNSGSECPVFRLQVTYTKFGTAVGSFVHNTEGFNAVGMEKIFKYDFGLAAAVGITFVVKGDFYYFIKITGELINVAGIDCRNHVINGRGISGIGIIEGKASYH